MTNAANAQAAMIRASWQGIAAMPRRASWDGATPQPKGAPVECLSNDAIAHARELAAAGLGTVTFTANRRAAELLGVDVDE